MPAKLFPPIIKPYIPAKLITSINTDSGIKIPFDINQFDNPSDITEIHVTITRQSNYASLLNGTSYPLGIIALGVSTLAQGYVLVPSTALTGEQLSLNEYYKVQLRFSGVTDSNKQGIGKTGAALSTVLRDETNLANYSEWSSVGLLRFISPLSIHSYANIQGANRELQNGASTAAHLLTHYLEFESKYDKADSTTDTVLGKNFKRSDDKEYLISYRVYLTTAGDSPTIVMDSGVQDINYRGDTSNEVLYNAPFYFPLNTPYLIHLQLVTCNLYEANFVYKVDCQISDNTWGSQQIINEFTGVDSVIGKVNISFEPAQGATIPANSKIIIRRGCRDDNFAKWEVIFEKEIASGEITSATPLSVDDFTIESGSLYKYGISFYNASNGQTYSIIEGPIISVFDHAFLTSKDTQLCVKFNPNVSNYKINVADNTVTTIGGKYPYIGRNGDMYYRTFSLSGTIAYEMDAEHQFATRSSIYGEWINVYGTYFVNRYFSQQNDRITQREFREMVMAYLYEDKPKLFRSTPEGNILVRLTDISLTPKQELARMIYDFSCIATEIGDCSVENYRLYDIHKFS